jgi:hypothetical protein
MECKLKSNIFSFFKKKLRSNKYSAGADCKSAPAFLNYLVAYPEQPGLKLYRFKRIIDPQLRGLRNHWVTELIYELDFYKDSVSFESGYAFGTENI